MVEKTFTFDSAREVQDILGRQGEFLAATEKAFDVSLVWRDLWLKIEGTAKAVEACDRFMARLLQVRNAGMTMNAALVSYVRRAFLDGREKELDHLLSIRVNGASGRPPVFPRTFGQARLLEAIAKNDVTVTTGPAGTGKTFLAMAMAVSALVNNEVNRIILTRPAVEAGEALGFLPGDLIQKVQPYLRPLYDALNELMPPESAAEYLEKGVIEVAPLAYMRGRTLARAFVVMDEAQNTTPEQMFMFLTRMGYGSKVVVTGDLTQVDLPHHKMSGLKEARRILKQVKGVAVIDLDESDVVRHPLVQRIVEAYQRGRTGEWSPKEEV